MRYQERGLLNSITNDSLEFCTSKTTWLFKKNEVTHYQIHSKQKFLQKTMDSYIRKRVQSFTYRLPWTNYQRHLHANTTDKEYCHAEY